MKNTTTTIAGIRVKDAESFLSLPCHHAMRGQFIDKHRVVHGLHPLWEHLRDNGDFAIKDGASQVSVFRRHSNGVESVQMGQFYGEAFHRYSVSIRFLGQMYHWFDGEASGGNAIEREHRDRLPGVIVTGHGFGNSASLIQGNDIARSWIESIIDNGSPFEFSKRFTHRDAEEIKGFLAWLLPKTNSDYARAGFEKTIGTTFPAYLRDLAESFSETNALSEEQRAFLGRYHSRVDGQSNAHLLSYDKGVFRTSMAANLKYDYNKARDLVDTQTPFHTPFGRFSFSNGLAICGCHRFDYAELRKFFDLDPVEVEKGEESIIDRLRKARGIAATYSPAIGWRNYQGDGNIADLGGWTDKDYTTRREIVEQAQNAQNWIVNGLNKANKIKSRVAVLDLLREYDPDAFAAYQEDNNGLSAFWIKRAKLSLYANARQADSRQRRQHALGVENAKESLAHWHHENKVREDILALVNTLRSGLAFDIEGKIIATGRLK